MKALGIGLLWSVSALSWIVAQPEDDSKAAEYESLQLHYFGYMEGNLDGTIYGLSKGVKMSLIAQNTEDNLRVDAEKVDFEWSDEEKPSLTRMVFSGDVVLVQADGTIRADKATINFETMEAVFTGNPVADIPGIRGAEAEFMQMNLDSGDVVAGGGGKVEEFRFHSDDDSDSSDSASQN